MSSKSFFRQIWDVFSNFSRHSPTFSWFSPSFSRISRSFPRICRTFSKFRRTFSKFRGKEKKFRGKKYKFRGKKSEKSPLKLREHQIVLSKPTGCFAKPTEFLTKTSETCDFQTLWESHNSQQLFRSSKSRVKWKGTICKVLLILVWCVAMWGEFLWFILRYIFQISSSEGRCLRRNW